MKKIMKVIISIIALTVMAPGQAQETNDSPVIGLIAQEAQDRLDAVVTMLTAPIIDFKFTAKDQECLAKNIFYEAASEPEEGKVAVGLVTLNRARDQRFPNSICGVVNQKTVLERVRTVTRQVRTLLGTREEKERVVTQVAVCQFSWRCMFVRKPKDADDRWQASQEVAQRLLQGDYSQWQAKYSTALYFHATSIKPIWAKGKAYVARVGGHHFYAERSI